MKAPLEMEWITPDQVAETMDGYHQCHNSGENPTQLGG